MEFLAIFSALRRWLPFSRSAMQGPQDSYVINAATTEVAEPIPRQGPGIAAPPLAFFRRGIRQVQWIGAAGSRWIMTESLVLNPPPYTSQETLPPYSQHRDGRQFFAGFACLQFSITRTCASSS